MQIYPITFDHNALLNYDADQHIDWTGTANNFSTTGTATIGTLNVDGVITAPFIHLKAGTTDAFLFKIEDGEDHVQCLPEGSNTEGFYFFEDAASGEAPKIRIYGYKSGGSLVYGTFAIVRPSTTDLFRITSSSGYIDFDDETLQGTGNLDFSGTANLGAGTAGLTLEGAGAKTTRRGASIVLEEDAAHTIGGYVFMNTAGQWVWSDAAQSSITDTGKAYIDCDTGDFQCDGTATIGGAITFDYYTSPLSIKNVGGTKTMQIEHDGAGYFQITGDGVADGGLGIAFPDTAGNNFYYGSGGTEKHMFGSAIKILEAAAALADDAAYGQLWVKNDAPCVLMFTDDTGADFTVDVTAV